MAWNNPKCVQLAWFEWKVVGGISGGKIQSTLNSNYGVPFQGGLDIAKLRSPVILLTPKASRHAWQNKGELRVEAIRD